MAVVSPSRRRDACAENGDRKELTQHAEFTFLPASDHGITPQSTDAKVADQCTGHAGDKATQQEGRTDLVHLMEQKFPRQFKVKGLMRRTHQPGSHLIGAVKQNRHGDWVADPDQTDRQGQIHTEQNGKACRHDHLARQWNEGHEQADRKCPRRRTAVQTPQIRVIQNVAKNFQRFLTLDQLVAWHESFNDVSRHCISYFYGLR